jgi:5-methylcytosine-specific restriction endonuclease McrA
LWVEANKDRKRKLDKIWRLNNRERKRRNGKAWNEANRDRLAARREERREEIRKIFKEWSKNNPESAKVRGARRRSRKANASGTVTRAQLVARITYYGELCYVCSKPYEAIDHVIPLAKGGTNFPANLRPICNSCNSRKKDRMPEIRRPNGFH